MLMIISMSNGGLFQLAARLARFTGNQTYADWADKVLTWMLDSTIIQQENNQWTVFDGAHVEDNCSTPVTLQWTYNPVS